MPVVHRAGPYTIRFFSNERGEPPHVHVDRDACTAKVWLEDPPRLALSRGYTAVEVRAVVKMVADHRQSCLDCWNAYFGTRDGPKSHD